MDLMRHGGGDHKGIFIAPCLLANVTEDMRICQLDAFVRVVFVPLDSQRETKIPAMTKNTVYVLGAAMCASTLGCLIG